LVQLSAQRFGHVGPGSHFDIDDENSATAVELKMYMVWRSIGKIENIGDAREGSWLRVGLYS
jgi:hypothetical protein